MSDVFQRNSNDIQFFLKANANKTGTKAVDWEYFNISIK